MTEAPVLKATMELVKSPASMQCVLRITKGKPDIACVNGWFVYLGPAKHVTKIR